MPSILLIGIPVCSLTLWIASMCRRIEDFGSDK